MVLVSKEFTIGVSVLHKWFNFKGVYNWGFYTQMVSASKQFINRFLYINGVSFK